MRAPFALLIFSALAISLGVHAADQLTPSACFVVGDELAQRVVRAPRSHRPFRPNSIWTAFQRDPRWDGGFSNDFTTLAVFQKSYWGSRSADTCLREMIRAHGRNMPRFFITFEPLGVRAINRLNSRRIYPIGLVTTTARVDGVDLTKTRFAAHDLLHAQLQESLLFSEAYFGHETWAKRRIIYDFYRTFDYERVVGGMAERSRLLFDLGYFLYFHEVFFDELWNHQFFNLLQNPRITASEIEIGYGMFANRIGVTFQDGMTRVKFRLADSLEIRRFLDRRDLYVNLPKEIKCEVALSPSPINVVRELVERALGVFFTEHYRHALRYTAKLGKLVPSSQVQ